MHTFPQAHRPNSIVQPWDGVQSSHHEPQHQFIQSHSISTPMSKQSETQSMRAQSASHQILVDKVADKVVTSNFFSSPKTESVTT